MSTYSYSIDIGGDVLDSDFEKSVVQRGLIVATAVAVSYMAAASGDMSVACVVYGITYGSADVGI